MAAMLSKHVAKILNLLALTVVYFIILLCVTWNIYTCIVTQRDGFRQINLHDNKKLHNDALQIHDIK